MTSIIKTILFCAENNIALRGDTSESGIFYNLLKFRAESGDEPLKKHLDNMAKNAKYTSPDIQNEIINVTSKYLVQKIVVEANKSFFSVIADESTDFSGKKQLSIVLRYLRGVDVMEEFVGFVELGSCTAADVSSAILFKLNEIGLNLDNLTGQGYDGASTMSGNINGVQATIREKYPKALYVHCSAHALNLVVNDQCKLPVIRNACDGMREAISYFKASEKRRKVLGVSIPLFSPTRWTEKYKSIRIFATNFQHVLNSLRSLETSESTAFSLRACLEKPKIAFSIVLIGKISSRIEPLAQYLQTSGINVSEVKGMVKALISSLEQYHDCSEMSQQIFKDACTCLEVDELPIPRLTKPMHATPLEFFYRTIFQPYIASIITSLKERFKEENFYFDLMSIVPPNTPHRVGAVAQFYNLDNLECEWSCGANN
jgi:hypothetical protein